MHSPYVRGPADPYTPAAHFLRWLAQFDTALRLRWSQRWSKWHLERKTAHAMEYVKHLARYVKSPSRAVVENDSWIRARDGYTLVRTFDPLPAFGDWTIRELCWGDPWRMSADALSRQLLAQEEKHVHSVNRKFDNTVEATAKDDYESMVWAGGERIAVPANYKNTE